MADEVFDGTDVVCQLFREGQRVTDEAGDALPHGMYLIKNNLIFFSEILKYVFYIVN